MMIAIDTGILALALNRWAPEHPRAARLVEDLAQGDLPWAVTWPALHELRVRVTHRHSVVRPLGPDEALAFIGELLKSPSLAALAPTPRHAEVMLELARSLGGDPLPGGFDSAVILREHGVRELLSADAGMRRFPFLNVVDPLRSETWSAAQPPARRYRRLR